MRVVLDLHGSLIRRAKRRASVERRTLTSVIEDALRRYLEPAPRQKGVFRLEVLTKRGRLLPGVDLADRVSLFDRLDSPERSG